MLVLECVGAGGVPVESPGSLRKASLLHPGHNVLLAGLHRVKHSHLAAGWLRTLDSMVLPAEHPS